MTSEFHFELPEALIAQEPPAERGASRMLVVDRRTGTWSDRWFRDLPAYLGPGDCLVLNNSRVFPSRLFGKRPGGDSAVEVFLLRPLKGDGSLWEALVRPGRRLQVGQRVDFEGGLGADIVARGEFGERTLRFQGEGDLLQKIEAIGHVPLPPYIKRPDTAQDRERYQTVFARESGSVAAPTAGLHFNAEVLEACKATGADMAMVTLHVGLGTFQPVRGEKLHSERFHVGEEAAAKIKAAARVVCVGTTSVRTVESWMLGRQNETDLFIRPGFAFQKTGAMLTNFHLPESSLLMLVCTFGGADLVLGAYRHAVEAGYRFYSYGDCMLVV